MTNYRRILMPTDLSECSWAALPTAQDLARDYGATLHVGFVIEHPHHLTSLNPYGVTNRGFDLDATVEEVTREAKRLIAQRIARSVDPVDAKIEVLQGTNTARTIVEMAKNLEADLIVISTHGHTGLKHLLLGSVTEKVIRTAPCSVLAIPVRKTSTGACDPAVAADPSPFPSFA
ncbi:MAG: universal stress protein [Planctomycetes bacterium]|nr:universal stress protein [Planctomycetota bacterium]